MQILEQKSSLLSEKSEYLMLTRVNKVYDLFGEMFSDVIKLMIEEHHAILMFSLEPLLMYDVCWNEKVVKSSGYRKFVIGTERYVSDEVKTLILETNVESASSLRCSTGSGEFEVVYVTTKDGNTYFGNYLVLLSNIEEFKYNALMVQKFKKYSTVQCFSQVNTDITKGIVKLVKSVSIYIDHAPSVRVWFSDEKWFKDNLAPEMWYDVKDSVSIKKYAKIQALKTSGYGFWDEVDNQFFGVFETVEECVTERDKYYQEL